ncbi:MAG: PEP-CTERM sorting domain-containing protein [bacterium]|nr:PEP-CTERM sorting domain-containing protein [bacterium]
MKTFSGLRHSITISPFQHSFMSLLFISVLALAGTLGNSVFASNLTVDFTTESFFINDQDSNDLNPADGILTFDHWVMSDVVGWRHYQGTAIYVPGTSSGGFGVELTDFTMTCDTNNPPSGSAGDYLRVQGYFTPGIPKGVWGKVTTGFSGSVTTTNDVERVYLTDLGTWTGFPTSSGHVEYVINPGYQSGPGLTTIPFDFGDVDSPTRRDRFDADWVTYDLLLPWIPTDNVTPGLTLPGSGSAIAHAVPEPCTILLLGSVLAGIGVFGKRKKRQLPF